MKRWPLLLGLVLAPGLAYAHVVAAQDAPRWIFEPWSSIPILISALVFAEGFARLFRRSTGGRRRLIRQGALFAAGLLVLAGAVASPLHQLGEQAFAAHMLEHELIMLAAAPLLVLSRPLPVMVWAFPLALRRGLGQISQSPPIASLWRSLSAPMTATILQAAALWLWHLPWLFDRALGSEGWHIAQHLSFFITALFFWTAMLAPRRNRWVSAFCLFLTSMISGALGALMALSLSPWYERYAALGMTPMHLTPVQDQQLAGLLMWAPGGMVHAAAAIILLVPALRAPAGKVARA